MNAKKELDWLFRHQIANTPLAFRRDFRRWWDELCKNIDKLFLKTIKDCKFDKDNVAIKEFEERAEKSRKEMLKIWKEKRDIERQVKELGV